jgi:ABC-type multidrug transport system fused ATPase/permease subunit
VLQPLWTLGVLAALAAAGGLVHLVNRRVEWHAHRSREQGQEIMGRLVEYVGGLRDILAAGCLRGFAAQVDPLLRANQRSNVRTAVWGQLSGLLPALTISLATLAYFYSGWRGAGDVAAVGMLVTYAGLLAQLFPAVFAVVRASTDVAVATPSLRALRDILEQPPVADRPGAVLLREPVRSVRFQDVILDLDGRRILDGLTCEIPGGKLTAVVGPSGAGKSTLCLLLLRLLEPTSGKILVNGRPLTGYTLESLREQFGYIPQDPFIFNSTLRDNILLAAPGEPAPERLAHGLGLAQLDGVVDGRRGQGGLDAAAGYLGQRLSGGEKQRLALARLLLRDPQVVLCDEYTANVDVRTARLIHATLRGHFAGRTRVLVTHDLAAARGADHVIVLDGGRVVQQGPPGQLVRQLGLYRELLGLPGPLFRRRLAAAAHPAGPPHGPCPSGS